VAVGEKGLGPLQEKSAEWLAALPPVLTKAFADTVYNAYDHADRLKLQPTAEDPYHMGEQTVAKADFPYRGVEGAQRLVIREHRSGHLQGLRTMRTKIDCGFYKKLLCVPHKILLIRDSRGGVNEDGSICTEEDYKVEFGEDIAGPNNALLYSEKSLVDIEATSNKKAGDANVENRKKLDKLCGKWGRFNVVLYYRGYVDEPGAELSQTSGFKRKRPDSRSSNSAGRSKGGGGAADTQSGTNAANDPEPIDLSYVYTTRHYKRYALDCPPRGNDGRIPISQFPAHVPGEIPRIRTVSLHQLAVETLTDFTRLDHPLDFLRSSKQALRAVHCVAMAMSCILREALGLETLPIEELCRGNMRAMVDSEEGEYNGELLGMMKMAEEGGLAKITKKDELEWFRDSYSAYVCDMLRMEYSTGRSSSPVRENRGGNPNAENNGTAADSAKVVAMMDF